MLYAPTLTTAEFSDVHNARCELHFVIQELADVVHPSMLARLQKSLDLLTKGLNRSYELEEQISEQREKHYDAIAKSICATIAVWSMNEVEDLTARHPYRGAVIMQYEGHEVGIVGPTWSDLYKSADAVIRLSGDLHHIFIEGFEFNADTQVLTLHTGS
jgi:hypothetical protein